MKQYLSIYSAALVEWRASIDQASCEISRLSNEKAAELSDEISQIQQHKIELEALEKKVELGWILYRNLEMETPDDDEVFVPALQSTVLN